MKVAFVLQYDSQSSMIIVAYISHHRMQQIHLMCHCCCWTTRLALFCFYFSLSAWLTITIAYLHVYSVQQDNSLCMVFVMPRLVQCYTIFKVSVLGFIGICFSIPIQYRYHAVSAIPSLIFQYQLRLYYSATMIGKREKRVCIDLCSCKAIPVTWSGSTHAIA